MPSLPRPPVRTMVSKAADVQVTMVSAAFRLAGSGADRLRRSGLPQVVGGVVGAGVGGVTGVAGALVSRLRPHPQVASPKQDRAGTVTVPGPGKREGARPATAPAAGTDTGLRPAAGVRTPPQVRTSSTERSAEPVGAQSEAEAVGAPGTATGQAEAAEQEAVEHGVVLDVVDHDDLPIPSYDEKTVGSLRPRLQRLDIDELVVLRAYEQAHAHRLQVLTMIENRIAKLRKLQEAAAPGDDAGSS